MKTVKLDFKKRFGKNVRTAPCRVGRRSRCPNWTSENHISMWCHHDDYVIKSPSLRWIFIFQCDVTSGPLCFHLIRIQPYLKILKWSRSLKASRCSHLKMISVSSIREAASSSCKKRPTPCKYFYYQEEEETKKHCCRLSEIFLG